jgi:hypothetical protein
MEKGEGGDGSDDNADMTTTGAAGGKEKRGTLLFLLVLVAVYSFFVLFHFPLYQFFFSLAYYLFLMSNAHNLFVFFVSLDLIRKEFKETVRTFQKVHPSFFNSRLIDFQRSYGLI